jgi:hypothetical protein
MALRIKELLYEDQYTIAGARKKLSSELRGASKLKVVPPPEANSQQIPSPVIHSAPPPPQQPVSEPARPRYESPAPSSSSVSMSDSQRLAVRHIAEQLRDLLATLDAGEADLTARRK